MSEASDKFFKYEIIREKPYNEPPFEILHAIMHERTGIDLCMNDEERRVRELIQWLNTNGVQYHIEYEEPMVRRRRVSFSDDVYSHLKLMRNRVFDSNSDDSADPESNFVFVGSGTNHFYLYVPHEAATLMKLFFEDFEHIPNPETDAEAAPLDIDAELDVQEKLEQWIVNLPSEIAPEPQNVTKADIDALAEKPKIFSWLGRFANNRRLPSDAS